MTGPLVPEWLSGRLGKRDICIALIIREGFLKDGSKLNRSIIESVKTSGTVHHRWSGPIVEMRKLSTEYYEDITLADFRHVIDYFVTYNSFEVREITSPQVPLSTPRAIRGVKICCYGEMKLHGTEPYVPIEVPYMNSIHRIHESDVSPISKVLGKSLRLWKFPDVETWFDPPGWNASLCASSNQDAAFLMMGADLGNDDWGWAPFHWDRDIGNAVAIFDDRTNIPVEYLSLMCYFVRRKLQPMFEDSLGMRLVSRTREVLKFITLENMEKFKSTQHDGKFVTPCLLRLKRSDAGLIASVPAIPLIPVVISKKFMPASMAETYTQTL